MYGVIVCPRCKRAKGVDLKQKTTTCACGFEIRIAPSRVRARADTARELASLVGQVSAELAGGLAAYRKAATPRAEGGPGTSTSGLWASHQSRTIVRAGSGPPPSN